MKITVIVIIVGSLLRFLKKLEDLRKLEIQTDYPDHRTMEIG